MGNGDHRHPQTLVLDLLRFLLALEAAQLRRAALEMMLALGGGEKQQQGRELKGREARSRRVRR